LLNYLSFHERLICSEELGNRHQTPTLIGCMLLTNLQDVQRCALRFLLAFAAISEALYSDRFFEGLSTSRVFADSFCFGFRLSAVSSEALNSIPGFEARAIRSALFFLNRCDRSAFARTAALLCRACDYSTEKSALDRRTISCTDEPAQTTSGSNR
jgi:hypothetical protein